MRSVDRNDVDENANIDKDLRRDLNPGCSPGCRDSRQALSSDGTKRLDFTLDPELAK
jgi:hypothetical protein